MPQGVVAAAVAGGAEACLTAAAVVVSQRPDRNPLLPSSPTDSEIVMTPEIENCLTRLLEHPRDNEIIKTLQQRLESEDHAEDMVSVRLWIESTRVISVRGRRIMAVADMRDDIEGGFGPRDVGGFIAELADKLVERMAQRVVDVAFEWPAVEAVTVRVKKLRPPIPLHADSTGVQIHRRRDDGDD